MTQGAYNNALLLHAKRSAVEKVHSALVKGINKAYQEAFALCLSSYEEGVVRDYTRSTKEFISEKFDILIAEIEKEIEAL